MKSSLNEIPGIKHGHFFWPDSLSGTVQLTKSTSQREKTEEKKNERNSTGNGKKKTKSSKLLPNKRLAGFKLKP